MSHIDLLKVRREKEKEKEGEMVKVEEKDQQCNYQFSCNSFHRLLQILYWECLELYLATIQLKKSIIFL